MGKISELLIKGCFINIDKPVGKTSHDIDLFLRKLFSVEKTSHFGTLDPAVTGVLPIAIGKAVKLFQYFQSGKEYVGVMKIHEEVDIKVVKDMISKHFFGKIKQVPPKKSAVKRVEREREVYSFEILENNGKDFLFKVSCEAGTYIRKLVHDLGEKLGCGAHMAELRRTRAGMFDEKSLVRLEDLMKAFNDYKEGDEKPLLSILIPKEVLLKELRVLGVDERTMKKIKQGGPIFFNDLKLRIKADPDERVAVTFNEELIAIFKTVKDERIFAKPDSVLI